ncbi:hypothetical protein H6G06_20435 [Anabaena sphaerica FACHB-251]|uniref:Uncharacterized protein n=1 Tax=Anabaena sphaerica FACHB-251 TaxID=2692883 RepID=A0A927A173_9NOST|nr:hypothetical protein [Anabaena sphaerica]MBD2295777.1 hypothetical protein [Anabaena sphaerica FACHB-251]
MMFTFPALLLIPGGSPFDLHLDKMTRHNPKTQNRFLLRHDDKSTEQWFYPISESASRGNAFFAARGVILQCAVIFYR